MYIPKAFREERVDVLHGMMRNIGVAAIVGVGPEGLIATHAPVFVDPVPTPEGKWGTLRCHFAKANPHAAALETTQEVLAIFQGPQSYITPAWYPTKQETGKVVPTWNYIAIHAYGKARVVNDAAWLLNHVSELTDFFEQEKMQGNEKSWKISDAPEEYIERMCKGITGIEIPLARLEGKWKLSQNRTLPERKGVVAGLQAERTGPSQMMADLVEQALS